MKNNEKRISLLNLPINCIYPRSTPQILSLNDKHTFHFEIF